MVILFGHKFEGVYKTAWKGCPSGAPVLAEKEVSKNLDAAYRGETKVNRKTIKKPYLLYVGRHEAWKRIDLVIRSLVRIVKQYPNIRLVIRGPFSAHTEALRELAKSLKVEDKVLFSVGGGNQKELKKLYSNAAVYVFPSRKEDLGIVIIEAMGVGLPVVAWNSGGPRDIVLDGQTGFLAKPFNLDDFAAETLKILKNKRLRRKMSRASWQRVKTHFSWKKHIEILE